MPKQFTYKFPAAECEYTYLQGDGYKFKDADEPQYKATLIFRGAAADQVKDDLDAIAAQLVPHWDARGFETVSDLPYPNYKRDGDELRVKIKTKVFGKRKKDGTTFKREVYLFDVNSDDYEGQVMGGMTIGVTATIYGWEFGPNVGISIRPEAVVVHEEAPPMVPTDSAERKAFFKDFAAGSSGATAPPAASAGEDDGDF